MKMKKKFYKVPLYKSDTNIMRLTRAGEIVCYVGTFGIKEVVTDKKIAMLNVLEINKRTIDEYVTKRSKMIKYFHRKALQEEGVKLYIKEEDLNKAKPISLEEFNDYFNRFNDLEFNRILKDIFNYQLKYQKVKK